jgi:alpha-amylase/alpha-mannosidase (GH57 family)
MQRHTLLMFTSCGWFFDEISRPEGVQILRYAMRVMELAGEVTGVQLEPEFVRQLEAAPSNVEEFGNGAVVYQKLVAPSKIELEQVAAHYAISSLFDSYAEEDRLYCYRVHQLDYQRQRMGSLHLAVGQLQLVSQVTAESSHLVFAVLHLGGWDFHCCIKPFTSRLSYSQLKSHLFRVMQQASTAQVILAMNEHFDGYFFGLQDIFAQERHRIMAWLNQETLSRLDNLYAQVYRDNFGVLVAFHRDGLPVPKELQVAAEIALSNRAVEAASQLNTARERGEDERTFLAELEAIAQEAQNLHCQLEIPQVKQTLETIIQQRLWDLIVFDEPQTWQQDAEAAIEQIERLEQLIDLGESLQLYLDLSRSQEIYFAWLHRRFLTSPEVEEASQPTQSNAEAIAAYCPLTCSVSPHPTSKFPSNNTQISAILAEKLLYLGEKLAVDVRTFR